MCATVAEVWRCILSRWTVAECCRWHLSKLQTHSSDWSYQSRRSFLPFFFPPKLNKVCCGAAYYFRHFLACNQDVLESDRDCGALCVCVCARMCLSVCVSPGVESTEGPLCLFFFFLLHLRRWSISVCAQPECMYLPPKVCAGMLQSRDESRFFFFFG